MLIDVGIGFTAAADNLSLSTSAYSVLTLTTTASCPVFIQSVFCTSSNVASTIQRLALGIVTGSTGGTSLTPLSVNTSGVTANSTVKTLASVGTPASQYFDAQQWNEFAPYEFNKKPNGIYVPVSTTVALYTPSALAAGIFASFTLEFVELR